MTKNKKDCEGYFEELAPKMMDDIASGIQKQFSDFWGKEDGIC